MRPRIFLLALAMVCGSAAALDPTFVPTEIVPRSVGKPVQTFKQDQGSERGLEIPAGNFPLRVFEESPDGQRFRIKVGNADAWVSKRDVQQKGNLNVQEMCSTVGPTMHAGATLNANEGCVKKR